MDLCSDWATLTKRLCHVENDNENHGTCDNVSLVSVEGAGRGVRAETDMAGGQVSNLNLPGDSLQCIKSLSYFAQVVFSDWALAVGPTEMSGPGDCSGCFLVPASAQCDQCGLGFCAEACKQVGEEI